MRFLLIALALVLPAPLTAQVPTEALRALWAELPAVSPGDRAEIGFGDLEVARGLDVSAVADARRDPVFLAMRALPPGPWQQAIGGDPRGAWRRAVGFAPGEVLRLASLSAPPVQASVIDLAPGAGAAVGPALAARGFAEVTQDGLTAWARGEDLRMDIRARDPDDPFDGGLGRSSRVQVMGDRLRHAVAWPVLATLGASPALTDGPHVAALLDALDRIKGAGALVGATLWADAVGLGLVDPLAIVTGAAPAPAGAPAAWGMALFADLSDGPTSTGVLALTVALPDAAAAEALRAHVARAWADRTTAQGGRSFAELTGGPVRTEVQMAAPGLWVLTLAQTQPTEVFTAGLTRNATLNRLLSGAMRRELVFLMP